MAQRALHSNPDSSEPYLNLADVLSRVDQFDDAEAAIQEAVKREPDSARAFMKLSEIRERINDYDGALKAVEQGLEISPDMVALYVRRGLIHFYNEDPEEGLKHIDKALSMAPEYVAAMQHKAELLISLNRNDEAKEIIEKVIELDKEIPGAYSTLVTLKKFESEDDIDFQHMKKLESKIDTYGQEAASVYFFAMSDAYEQLKNYDKAFKFLKKANDIKRKLVPHARWKEDNLHKAIETQYTPELLTRLSGSGYDSDVPIFIVGMPRSGTTLTEQILSSHPDIYGAGELRELGDVHCILPHKMTPEDMKTLGKEYVDLVKQKDKTGKALRIVDKMPANYLYLGFVASILPNAKIIHCRRNPIDTCLSCYKQSFARGQYFSYDLEDLATEYQAYLDLMDYWREVLPGRILEVDYEETVGNFEEQARKLIDHVGLEWNDACLEPHKQKRTVITASKAQVTQPIYKTSVEKWKRYEKDLQPLVKRLLPDQAL